MRLVRNGQILLGTLRESGPIGAWRRARKSLAMRWRCRRGRMLNEQKGWRSDRPILVIESDDWGMELVANHEAREAMTQACATPADAFSMLDGLEKPQDVRMLCEVLAAHKDAQGRPAVMTVNFIMANADFDAIEASGYQEFHAKTIDHGWNHEPDTEGLWRSYRKGIDNGVLTPQLHGYLHFSPDEWLQQLRQGDPNSRVAFGLKMIGHMNESSGLPVLGVSSLYHQDAQSIRRLVDHGIQVFERAFGRKSVTSIAPRYVWRTPATEEAMAARGIRAIQGKEFQYLPDGNIKLHYLGERGPAGMLYLTRTCRLEPVPDDSTADDCVAQITRAFELGIPAVLCSHRMNYTSRVAPRIREKGLAVLDGVLEQVTTRFPDVEFLSSDRLAVRMMGQS